MNVHSKEIGQTAFKALFDLWFVGYLAKKLDESMNLWEIIVKFRVTKVSSRPIHF